MTTDLSQFTPEELESALKWAEGSGHAGPPVAPAIREALLPLVVDRRWMSDDLAEVGGWLVERFQDTDDLDHRLRALMYVMLGILERMAQSTPGLTPIHVKKLIRDPVTKQILGVSEGVVPTL